MMGLDLNKSSIGVPSRCIKLSCPFISEALTKIFNHSLEQGIVPDILKISKITPVDKGATQLTLRIISQLQLYQFSLKYLKN